MIPVGSYALTGFFVLRAMHKRPKPTNTELSRADTAALAAIFDLLAKYDFEDRKLALEACEAPLTRGRFGGDKPPEIWN